MKRIWKCDSCSFEREADVPESVQKRIINDEYEQIEKGENKP